MILEKKNRFQINTTGVKKRNWIWYRGLTDGKTLSERLRERSFDSLVQTPCGNGFVTISKSF
jgi:hypothetical protein